MKQTGVPMGKRNKHAGKTASSGENVKTRGLWLYGYHPVVAAIRARRRHFERLLVTKETLTELNAENLTLPVAPETVSRGDLTLMLPKGAVHQGIAALVSPLDDIALEDVDLSGNGVIAVLDQVTDPHNIGAVLRSAAAFDAMAVVVTEKNAPEATATLAKSACGALETVPLVYVTNLARSLDQLKDNGFWCVGLDGRAEKEMHAADLPDKCVLIFGSEGYGMRRLTAQSCDMTVKLPISSKIESLNVSNAAAIALYEYAMQKREK